MQESLKAGHVLTLPTVNTIADGTAVKRPGEKLFPYIQKNVDDIITVEDSELIVAFLDMVENHKMIVENSGLSNRSGIEALKCTEKEDCFHLKRRQHGCHYHVLRGTAWTDPERPYLHRIRSASGQARRAGKGFNAPC